MRKALLMTCVVNLLFASHVFAGMDEPYLPYANGKTEVKIVDAKTDPLSGDRIVKIQVRSMSGAFKVYQRLERPFASAGKYLGSGAIEYATTKLVGAGGVLYQESQYLPLNESTNMLFTSPVTVTPSDVYSFEIIYRVAEDRARIQSPGYYESKIWYDMIVDGAGGQSEQKQITVIADVTDGNLAYTTESSSGSPNALMINASGPDGKMGVFSINLTNLGGGVYDLEQTVEVPFGFVGKQADALTYKVVSDSGEAVSQSPVFLPETPNAQKIYRVAGVGQDQIDLVFEIDPNTLIPAGSYLARVRYALKSNGNVVADIPLDISLTVPPTLDLQVSSPDKNVSNLFDFSSTSAKEGVVERFVKLRVKSNLGRSYSVVQNLMLPLSASQGAIMEDNFVVAVSEPAQKGRSLLGEAPAPVKSGDTVVFTSDAQGSPDEFVLKYTVKADEKTRAGVYNTRISYSIVEN